MTFYKPNIKSTLNREDIRILVQSVGYQKAAQQTGIKYATLRQWAKRHHWNDVVPKYLNALVTKVTTTPANAHADALRSLEGATRMSLAKSAARMAKDAEEANLRHSGHVKEVAQTAAIVHNWGNDKGNTQILNVAVLTGQEVPEKVIDVGGTSG